MNLRLGESTCEDEPRFHSDTMCDVFGNLSHNYYCSFHRQISRQEACCWRRG